MRPAQICDVTAPYVFGVFLADKASVVLNASDRTEKAEINSEARYIRKHRLRSFFRRATTISSLHRRSNERPTGGWMMNDRY